MTTFDPTPPASASTENPAPGWYPDPVRDGRGERWWTGESWSGHSRTAGETMAAPPLVPVASAPATSAPTAFTRLAPRNGTAWAALAFGLVALGIALGSIFGHGGYWVSTIGVIAIVQGARAIRLRSRGEATAFVPAVIGIAAGALATVLMLALVVLPSTGEEPGSGPVSGAMPGSGAVGANGAAPGGTLDAIPTQPLPDDALSTYRALTTRSVTSAAARCGVVRAQAQVVPLDQRQRTAARVRQDFIDLQVQQMAQVLAQGVKTTKAWPSILDVDPETGVVFTPAPACAPLGVLPKGTRLQYGRSKDHGQVALAVWDPAVKVGTVWRSVDDTLYQL
jgi:hypothetical protein